MTGDGRPDPERDVDGSDYTPPSDGDNDDDDGGEGDGISDGVGRDGADSEAASDGGTTVSEPTPSGDDPFLDGPESDQEMPLADHIEEMINRLGVVAVAMAVVGVVALPFSDQLINEIWYGILGPIANDVEGIRPHVYHPLALVLARLKVATLAGFVIALPIFVYETYLFMRPGLYRHERRYYLAAVPTSLVLAFIGVAFAFYLVLPAIFIYFVRYSSEAAEIAFGLTETFNLMLMMMGFFAAVFQIPLLIMLAVMMNLTSREWLAQRRLYFWGGFLGVALLFSPDPTGMAPIIVALTMVTLFEGTLLLLRWVQR
ncbi:twin-arginine translocase subunit TatC [Halomarina halobia]|uniref:Sec-independent protein translocase protein TatC n=1 Tax=Halomarina halobia TaxID=3033386 RepID=A0ABD6ABA8_9EURY